MLFISISIVLLLSGCGITEKTMNCSRTKTDENGYKTEDKIIVKYQDNKVTNVEQTTIQEMSKEAASMAYSFGQLFSSKLNEIDGFNATYTQEDDTKIKSTVSVDYTKFDIDKVKEVLGSSVDTTDAFYTKKDLDIETFKSENLKDYSCN